MVANELAVSLPCECGAAVVARAADAGGAVVCSCGRSVAVPNLSKLRTLAGAEAYVTNPAEAIRKAQAAGNDPAGDKCLMCGSAAPVFYQCTAVCEQSHVKREANEAPGMLQWLFLPMILNYLLWFRQKDTVADRQGHDVEVTFTLPVCKLCEMSTGRVTRPSVARQLMQRAPLYRDLLEFYPNLKLQFGPNSAD